jgi:NAD(P)-dependent dehydrogenase (short-subunit alcohol dehydrogenase family)
VAGGAVVVVGGTSGIGLRLAETYAARGTNVVITGRDISRCSDIAAAVSGPGEVTPIALDLAEPEKIETALEHVGPVDRLALAAIERDYNSVQEYDIGRALRLVTLKLVGYTEVVHALASRLSPESSILVFGGQALRRPYPGSTTVTTVNGGVTGLVRTLALQLAPIRVNAIHPGIVGDSPYWSGKDQALAAVRQRALTGRYVAMSEIVDAAVMMLENTSIAATELRVDGGWHLPL